MTAVETAQRHLARLASTARPAGSPAEDVARGHCADTLASLGFTVTEEAFEYSTLPGKWATAVAGIASIACLAAAGYLGSRGNAPAALAVLGLALAGGAPLAMWITRRGVLRLPFRRALGINLRATRGAGEPRVWLVAHLDSKSQPVPIAARAVGIIASAIIWLAALGVAASQAAGAPLAGWWIWLAAVGGFAGVPVAASLVGRRSPGAVDNASGVAAVLLAAEIADRGPSVGVLITSAEELGLAGARAIASTSRPSIALNCDTIDDDAPLFCLPAGSRSTRAADALVRAAGEIAVPITRRRLLPGILADAVALADAGWDCATLSAATWRTLRRVHTVRDTTAELRGDGLVRAGRVLAGAVRILGAR